VADHNVLGADGERIAAEFLESKGLSILAKNYRKPYGEIDLVARETSGIVHFVEVKSVSSGGRSRDVGGVSHETYRPEDNVHGEKLLRLGRVIQTYIVSHEIDDDWQFDVITVVVDRARREARVKWLQDIII
jgi:putative endonuclease